MAVVVDDLVGWLVGLLADAARKKLAALVLGSEQERALRRAAAAAIRSTAAQLAPRGSVSAEQLATVIAEVFREPPGVALAGRGTLLEALQAGIAAQLAILDDPGVTGTSQSSAEGLGVSGSVLAEALAGHLVQEIMLRGSGGGPLKPLADQLNHDMTHLQLAQLADHVTALARPGAPVVPGKPVRLPPRPGFLAGREDLLADLDARLTSGNGPGPRIVALSGLGGTGKTSVAVEYAHRHLDQVEVAWQLPAEDATVLAAGFAELAAQLGTGAAAGRGDPVAAVHRVLASVPAGWLLIFDNAPDRASVARFLPPAGPGRVLVTSQNPAWPPGQSLDVPVLDTEVAADFLVNRTGDPDSQTAAELAAELGGLPLALEQAGASMVAVRDSLASYLAAVRQRRRELLARGEPAGYPGTVATTWALAFARLEQAAPGAVSLLRLLAFCAPEAIPLRLLLQPRRGLTRRPRRPVAKALKPLLEDELAARGAVAALRRYSLISPVGGGSVLMHWLVQAVTADQMPADLARAWQRAAAALVEAALPEDPQQPDTWPSYAALLPHAQAALADDSDRMGQLASYLFYQGSYAAALELLQRVVTALERSSGPGHPGTLAARGNLAYLTGEAGDAAGARDQHAALLPIMERVLGPEDPLTLGTRGNLAYWTGVAGDAAGARDQHAALLPIMERVLGPEHPDTLTTRGNIAAWTGMAGDAAAARDQHAALLPIMERISGPEHPLTLATRANLARWTGEAGDAVGARDQIAALRPIEERMLGPEHPNTLTTRAQLAYWTGMAGDAAAARDQHAALLPIIERVRSPEHPDTLTIRSGLARWTGEAGDAAGARDQSAALLPIREQLLGPEHPDTLTTRDQLAYWTREAGDGVDTGVN